MALKSISLVTGGAGFIGSHVVGELIKKNHKVVILDDLSGGFKENINPKATFVKGSITHSKLLEKLFEKYQFDYVFHLAAYAAEGLSHFIRRYNYVNNLIGSINLINLSVKYNIERFIFTSSIAVYGTNQTPFTEKTIPHPEDPYGISKYAVELDLQNAKNIFGLPYTIFRPHNVYGIRQNIADPFRNVVGIFMKQILQNYPLTIFGNGKQTRAFSYIDDVAPYIANCINIKKSENKIFNIGSDSQYTVLEIAKLVSKYMNVKNNIKFLDKRNEVEHAFSNHEFAQKIFKIKSMTSLDEGIKKTTQWVKNTKMNKSKIHFKLELDKNLPESWKAYF
ncbi:MAG: NAD-dependent epimerase/dehydratase family protein [bacterium]|nr:NAD-dependent epimerase/dehydratase family protein [bacterium]